MTSDTNDTVMIHSVCNSNTKQTQCRRYIFTLNNYTKEELIQLIQHFKDKSWDYIVGEEIGKESKIHHLQGYIEHKSPIRFNTLKKMNNRLHIEKSTKTKMAAILYCAKDNKYHTNIDLTKYETREQKIIKAEYNNVKWRDWQLDILSLIKNKPDNRKIHWFYDTDGNIGKSYLFKYLCLTNKNIVIADGKKDNIFNQINTLIQNKNEPEIILLDVPRTNEDYFNYGAIEQIKNGAIYSGKYEGGICLFKIPHIIIFSNFRPDKEKWSQDRYDIKNITRAFSNE